MVKKSSFLEKLRNRWRSPSGMRIDAGSDRTPLASVPAKQGPAEPAARTKLTPREDALMALGEGFAELAGLMRGVQTRLDGQGEQAAALATRIEQLPMLGAAQLEALRALAASIEKQQASSDAILTRIGDLPQALATVQRALDRAAATDERAVTTLNEFRTTMERVQGAIGEMVQSSKTQAQATQALVQDQRAGQLRVLETIRDERTQHHQDVRDVVDGFGRTQAESSQRIEAVTKEGLGALRRSHEDQATRIAKLVAEQGRTNRAVVVLTVLSFLALLAIAVLLAMR